MTAFTQLAISVALTYIWLPLLGVEALHVDGWSGSCAASEHLDGAVEKLSLPLRNLIGMDVEHCVSSASVFFPLTAAKATFALKAGEWLIDLERLFDLWVEFYPKLDEMARERLPISPIYFITLRV